MIDVYDIRQAFLEMNEETKRFVLSQPEIDAVPVVRCKDCVFSEKFPHEESVFNCTHPQWRKTKYGVYKEDYCSYGERREDNG